MYLANSTRPDIFDAVSKLSRFVKNPGDTHWGAIERVMRYLKGTMSYGIHYSGHDTVMPTGSLMLMSLCLKRMCVSVWRWRCFLEVLQADYLNEVYNGSRARCIGHCWG
jgi:hypothetical protein